MITASSATVVVFEVAGKAVVVDHDGLVTVPDMPVSIQAFALDATEAIIRPTGRDGLPGSLSGPRRAGQPGHG